jgi:murein DD-endopeptidase MepM/ murein hydrolase activator NlpD
LILGTFVLIVANSLPPVSTPDAAPTRVPVPAEVSQTFEIRARQLGKGQTLSQALSKLDVPGDQAQEIIGALSGVFDSRKARPGDELRVTTRLGQVELFEYRRSAVDEWYVRLDQGRMVGSRRSIEIEKQIVPISISIDGSLYEAIQAAGEDPVLALAISDAFAWDIDFYQDVRRGDRVRAVVERYSARGQILRYGEVLAAEYEGGLVGKKRLFLFDDGHGASYFDADGTSARKVFLKSPLKYAVVTSKFGMRFHPILQYVRQHAGVDYGAAPGTPVWAVGDGTVVKAGYSGESGNLVCVHHANAYESCYAHLQAIARGVRPGARIAQKQVIGWVGSTGLATGPHLHYAVKKVGHFVNPLALKFPRAEPLRGDQLAQFGSSIDPYREQLDAIPVAAAAPVSRPGG